MPSHHTPQPNRDGAHVETDVVPLTASPVQPWREAACSHFAAGELDAALLVLAKRGNVYLADRRADEVRVATDMCLNEHALALVPESGSMLREINTSCQAERLKRSPRDRFFEA